MRTLFNAILFRSVSCSNSDFADLSMNADFWHHLYEVLDGPIESESDESVSLNSGSTNHEERLSPVSLDADLSDEALLISILRRDGMKSTLDVYEAGIIPGRSRWDYRFVDELMLEISYMLHFSPTVHLLLERYSREGTSSAQTIAAISPTLIKMRLYNFSGTPTSFLTACKAWIDFCVLPKIRKPVCFQKQDGSWTLTDAQFKTFLERREMQAKTRTVPYSPEGPFPGTAIPNYRKKSILGKRKNCASSGGQLRCFVLEYLLSGSKEDVVSYVSERYGSSRESIERVVNRHHEEIVSLTVEPLWFHKILLSTSNASDSIAAVERIESLPDLINRVEVWRKYCIEPLRAMEYKERPCVVDEKSQSVRLLRIMKTRFLNDELGKLI